MSLDSHSVPGTKILVDFFRPPVPTWASAFFLTHYHADHYGGLSFRWRGKRIYASEATSRLVVNHLGVSADIVMSLPMNQKIEVQEERKIGLTVTLLDANHCPGSVLMLFETGNGKRFLHTGDMRYHPRMRLYSELSQGGQLDVLYQDTTYCNIKYKFPVQDEAVQLLVDLAKQEMRVSERTLILIATYLIGKERVLEALSRAFGGRKVFVNPNKDNILKQLNLPYYSEVFTMNPLETNIHVTAWEAFIESVPWGFKPHYEKMTEIVRTENVRKLGETGEQNYYQSALGFVPTGWSWNVKGNLSVSGKDNCKIYGVPYSEHSSFSELTEWVGFLRPKKLVPTVGATNHSKYAAIMNCFCGLIDETAAKSEFFAKFRAGTAKGELTKLSRNRLSEPPPSESVTDGSQDKYESLEAQFAEKLRKTNVSTHMKRDSTSLSQQKEPATSEETHTPSAVVSRVSQQMQEAEDIIQISSSTAAHGSPNSKSKMSAEPNMVPEGPHTPKKRKLGNNGLQQTSIASFFKSC